MKRWLEVLTAVAAVLATSGVLIGGVRWAVDPLREDVHALRAGVRADIGELRAEVRSDIDELRAEFRSDIGELRADVADIRERLVRVEEAVMRLEDHHEARPHGAGAKASELGRASAG